MIFLVAREQDDLSPPGGQGAWKGVFVCGVCVCAYVFVSRDQSTCMCTKYLSTHIHTLTHTHTRIYALDSVVHKVYGFSLLIISLSLSLSLSRARARALSLSLSFGEGSQSLSGSAREPLNPKSKPSNLNPNMSRAVGGVKASLGSG